MAYSSALTICGKPAVPSVSDTGVSTSRMLAPGAMVCAYSTSRVVSPPQPVMSELFLFHFGISPDGVMILNDGGAGSLNCWSKTARSCLIVGDPNESTITIVSPLPVTPARYSGGRLYASSTWPGVRQW